jgi:alpha-D-xyloside xylohydrolase
MKFRSICLLSLLTAAVMTAASLACAAEKPAIQVRKEASGLVMRNGDETVHVSVCGPNVLHVVAGPGDPKGASPHTPWLIKQCEPGLFDVTEDGEEAVLSTADVKLAVNLHNGLLAFRNAHGDPLLAEMWRRPRVYTPDTVNGEKVLHVKNRFVIGAAEGFYGLGQHQSGAFNYRGNVVELAQANTDVALPLLVSTNGYGLLWNTASHSWFDDRFPSEMTLSAEAADAIDYYFIYGPEMDQIVHTYREMTGHAPLFGKWAYGFVQSKDRYRSAKELLDVAAEYRQKHVPTDLIVQDWFWWKTQGDPVYTDEYLMPYPDVADAIRKLHDQHVHTIISVWAVLDRNSETYKKMEAAGLTIPGTDDYDATNPKARDAYWNLLVSKMYAQGWDGFWLDSAEPECCGGFSDGTLDTVKLSIGNGARYTNIFPLMHSGNVYDHWRATTDRRRIFILTRSAFAGQQRNSTTIWSGDVTGTFSTFRKQIPAGLNFELSGIPYWTTDIAGYGWPLERDTRDPRYQELYTRSGWSRYRPACAPCRR